MRHELEWSAAHVLVKRDVIHSDRSDRVLLDELSAHLISRPGRRKEIVGGLVGEMHSALTFDEFLTDFSKHGSEAIETRSLWGTIFGSEFQIEIATGLGAQRWWIPRIKGGIVPDEIGKSLIRYQIRGIQRRQVLIAVLAMALSTAAVCVGLALIFGGSDLVGALASIVVGAILLTLSLWFVRTAARVAAAMEQSLITRLKRLANA